jgi:hypothetical protein
VRLSIESDKKLHPFGKVVKILIAGSPPARPPHGALWHTDNNLKAQTERQRDREKERKRDREKERKRDSLGDTDLEIEPPTDSLRASLAG